MKYKQPPGSRKPPVDEYRPITMPEKEPPKKKGSGLIIFILTFFLVVV